MSLLCAECRSALHPSEGYIILCVLGHTKIGLEKPEETPVSIILCGKHHTPFAVMTEEQLKKQLKEENADALLFAIVRGTYQDASNFNGNFAMADGEKMKKQGDFANAEIVLGWSVEETFPRAFKILLEAVPQLPLTFKKGVERYLENRKRRPVGHR